MVLKLLKLTFLLMILKTPPAWGFSFEQTERYKQEAASLRLAESPQWLRLGHYHQTLFGNYKSKIRGNFFISPRGAKDPVDELNQTIERLFSSEENAQLQCRYLARTQWLKAKLHINAEDLITCPQRDAWKKKLNTQEVFLIFAASDLSSAASSFGHTFLRLHNPANKAQLDLLDYGVNFAAQTDETDGAMFALKGLFGMYEGFYSMEPFHQKIREYINLEGRDIWEYQIDLTPVEIEMLVNHLLELEGSSVPYYFLDDNCSYQIMELLEVARPGLDLTSKFVDLTIPIDTLKLMGAQPGFLSGERRRPSLQSQFQNSYFKLTSAQKDELVRLVEAIRANSIPLRAFEKPTIDIPKREAPVLDAALNYVAIQEYREHKSLKEWKYQLAVERASLGGASEMAPSHQDSPLRAARSAAFYLGIGQRDGRDFGRVKFRRAFHDLISRDEGISPFTHMEVLSLAGSYEFKPQRWDLEQIQLLKIISTNPVTRLGQPLSWKVSFGAEPKLDPFAEAGIGYSLDFDIGQSSRWINLLSCRAFRLQEKDYVGGGVESIFVQKLTSRFRALESVQYLAVNQDVPYLRAELAFSYDLQSWLEMRLSLQRNQTQNISLLSLVF